MATAMPVVAGTDVNYDHVYRFDQPGYSTAEWWTVQDALFTIVNWFVPYEMMGIAVQHLASHADLVEVALTETSVQREPVSHAITNILRQMGYTWTIRWDMRASNLYPTSGIRPELVVMADSIASTADWGAWLAGPQTSGSAMFPTQQPVPAADTDAAIVVDTWEMDEDISKAVTRTEVRGDDDVCEILWTYNSSDESAGLLKSVQVPHGQDYTYAFAQQPAYFSSNSDALLYFGAAGDTYAPAGTPSATESLLVAATENHIQVEWMRRLRDPDYDGDAARYDEQADMKASDAVYMFATEDEYNAAVVIAGSGGTPLPYRLKSGYQVNYRNGLILLKSKVVQWSAWGDDDGEEVELIDVPYRLYFSCPCKLPSATVSAVYNPAPMPYDRTRICMARGIRSYMREMAYLPRTAGADRPSIYDGVPLVWLGSVSGTGWSMRRATGIGEPVTRIVDATETLAVRASKISAASGSKRFRGTIAFARAPWINLGDRIYWPYMNPGFPAYTRVLDCQTDFEAMRTTVRVEETFL